MRIRFQCPQCGTVVKAAANHAGKRARCPNPQCGNVLTIPAQSPTASVDESTKAMQSPNSLTTNSPRVPRVRKPPVAFEKSPKSESDNKQPARAPRLDADVEKSAKTGEKKTSKKKQRKSSLNQRLFWSTIVLCGGIVGAIVMKTLLPHRGAVVQASAVAQEEEQFRHDVQPFFQKYCFDCHNLQSQDGGLSLDQYKDVAAIQGNRKTWEKVLGRLKIGAMPPSEAVQPSKEDRERISDWLGHRLFDVDCGSDHDPGRVTIRRLNRFQYNNTIRDLTGVNDFQPAANFPSDDIGYGFDNIGDVLSVPPLLVEKYLDAAEQIASRAILASNPKRKIEHRHHKELKKEGAGGEQGDFKVLASNGEVFAEFEIPEDNEYILRTLAQANQAGDELAKLELRLDGKALETFDIKGEHEPNSLEKRLKLAKGKHRIAAAFTNDFFDKATKADRNLFVKFLEVDGPILLSDRSSLPKSHLQIVRSVPNENVSNEDAALGCLREFLYRAFRRPVNDAEALQYAKFVTLATARGESYERGMQVAVQAALVSPDFLFRVEHQVDRHGHSRGELTDFELASRLSYFLWGSMPDDELLESARLGKLNQTTELEHQFDRMLKHERRQAFINDFSSQWLGLTKFNSDDVAPDPDRFPQFNRELREAMREESVRFFGAIVRENRSVMDLIDGKFTFVNESLANLYGLSGVRGPEFRRVELTDGRRGGIITQASILTLTSYPTRTSPVKRGEWVLANILGEAPPPPPPVVPGLEETQKSNPNLPLRKQLEIHRADPGCASCHRVMDDLGFGLEHFDAIGRWRERDGDFEIDSHGSLPTGESFSAPHELIAILRKRETQFARCLSEKILTYALGRGLEYYDQCVLNEITKLAAADGNKLTTLIKGVVLSEAFRQRRAE